MGVGVLGLEDGVGVFFGVKAFPGPLLGIKTLSVHEREDFVPLARACWSCWQKEVGVEVLAKL